MPLPCGLDSDSDSEHVSYRIVFYLSTRAGMGSGYSVLVDGHGESVVWRFKMNADLLVRTEFAGGHVPSYARMFVRRLMILMAGIFPDRLADIRTPMVNPIPLQAYGIPSRISNSDTVEALVWLARMRGHGLRRCRYGMHAYAKYADEAIFIPMHVT